MYYDALSDMDTERFTVAAQAILRQSGRVYFPTPGELRAEAEAWKPVPSSRLLPMSTEGLAALEADRDRRRENVKAGLERIREFALAEGAVAPGSARPEGRVMQMRKGPDGVYDRAPQGVVNVEATDERRAELARQAEEITRNA